MRGDKTAEQRKNEELYGRTASTLGTNKKSDGTLMASAADWRNTSQKHTNGPLKGQHQESGQGNSKDMKY